MNVNAFTSLFKDIKLPLHGVRLPSFEITSEQKRKAGFSEDLDNFQFLSALCKKRLEDLVPRENDRYSAYNKRLEHELSTILDLSFVDYILLVWHVINYCKEQDIPVGLGRGSAAGSLVLYLAGVTGIDPIKHDLYFERFISKIRAKKKEVDGITYLDGSLMCDVDLDICYYNRQKVISFLEKEFKDRTSKILTLNTLSGKLLIKECGKIITETSESDMNGVSNMIPKVFGLVQDINVAYESEDLFRKWCDDNKQVYEIALSLRGLIKNKGVHPSGILLSYDTLNTNSPIELSSDKSQVSSFDMNWASILNVKLDLLGLRGVSVAHDVCEQVGININDIDLEDPIIYQNLYDLNHPHGLFQIEADTNFKVCQKVRPKNLSELSGVLALARPGALAFVDQYAEYTNTGETESIHPYFDDILSSTGGVALYQEQLMKMAHKVGFSLDEAEILRRIVGKKKTAEVTRWKKKIQTRIKRNNLDPEIGNVLWNVLENSANYSFNKSHSIAYAALAAVTVYLKFKHPKEFFLSLLKMTRHEPDPISEISKTSREMHAFDIKLLPPHLTKSKMDFTIEGKDIRFGLLSIKGISDKSIEKLNDFKDEYSNKFEIFQAATEAKLGIGILSALIQAGALEGFSQSRTKVVYEAQLWNILTVKEKRWALKFAEQYDYDLVDVVKKLQSFKDEKNKEVIKETRYETIKRKSADYAKIYRLNSKSQDFANWYYENLLLGYTYDITLREIFSTYEGQTLMSVSTVKEIDVDSRVIFIGHVDKIYSGTSRNGNKYLKLTVSDEAGSVDAMIFNKKMESCIVANNNELIKKQDIVIVKGVKKDGVVFADTIGAQMNRVYTKLSELKNV